ncbi:hypothetical protein J4218_06045 [Candidatus Pacearchaeota archaeon]|nr:hypothetical protein [Candidatus Pacearchaeota archaeon]
MPIKVDSLEFMHSFLKRPPIEEESRHSTPNREFQSLTDESIMEVNRPIPFQYNPFGLPLPYDEVTVSFKRCGSHYSVAFLIDAKRPDVFTFRGFGEALAEKKYKLVSMSPGRNAMILNASGDVAFTIKAVNNDLLRLVCMGTAGAHTRDLPEDPSIFIKEVGTLEVVANSFLECQLRSIRDAEGVDELLKGMVYLNP